MIIKLDKNITANIGYSGIKPIKHPNKIAMLIHTFIQIIHPPSGL